MGTSGSFKTTNSFSHHSGARPETVTWPHTEFYRTPLAESMQDGQTKSCFSQYREFVSLARTSQLSLPSWEPKQSLMFDLSSLTTGDATISISLTRNTRLSLAPQSKVMVATRTRQRFCQTMARTQTRRAVNHH